MRELLEIKVDLFIKNITKLDRIKKNGELNTDPKYFGIFLKKDINPLDRIYDDKGNFFHVKFIDDSFIFNNFAFNKNDCRLFFYNEDGRPKYVIFVVDFSGDIKDYACEFNNPLNPEDLRLLYESLSLALEFKEPMHFTPILDYGKPQEALLQLRLLAKFTQEEKQNEK